MKARLAVVSALVLSVHVVAQASAPVTPPAVDQRLDLRYSEASTDARRNCLDLYLPTAVAHRPIVLFVHGGSWTIGSKEQHEFVGDFLARNGFAAAVMNYRLAPFARWPAFAEDCAAACAFLAAHAEEYDLDMHRLFLVGHSAGAQIAGVVAFDRQWLRAAGVPDLEIRGFVGLSGPYDLRPPLPALAQLFGKTARARGGASPVCCVGRGEPPALLFHAENDLANLDLSARLLAARLRLCGNSVEVARQPGNHISYVFGLGQAGSSLAAPLLQFLRRHCEADDGTVGTTTAGAPVAPPTDGEVVATTAPAAVRRDIAFADGSDQRLDLWLPARTAGERPARLVAFACSGDRALLAAAAPVWAKAGLAVALIPVRSGADGDGDLAAACRWLHDHQGELGLAARFVLAGCEGEATRALVCGSDPQRREACGFGREGLAAVAAICPPADAPTVVSEPGGPNLIALHPEEAAVTAASRPGRVSMAPGAMVPLPLPFRDAAAMLQSVGRDDDGLTAILLALAGC